jgi:[ribosomal protein S18]-alanine N-acetyltransferase
MPKLILRLASPADAREIAVMSRCLVEVGLRGWTWHPARVAKAIRSTRTNVLIAAYGRKLAGFAIMEYGDTRAHLSLLAVQPACQRRGIGSRMVAWLEETALAAGIEHITLELRVCNFAARCFYRALGFSDALYIRGYYRGEETALRMSRNIRRSVSPVNRLSRPQS